MNTSSCLKKSKIKKKQKNINLNNSFKKRVDDLIYFLSEDIKQYQHDLKLLGPHHKTVETLNDKILSKLAENNYEIIQIILNKKKRTNEELIIVKTFLSTMKYLSSMIKIIDTDKILFSLSVYLKMESKNKDSILFRYGNKGNKFYILLSGQVTILILKETKVQISFLRYFLHLIQLKMMKEEELLKKTIIVNKNLKYKLDERTFEFIFDKLVKFWELKEKNKPKKNEEEKTEESYEESDHLSEKENKNINKSLSKRKTAIKLNYLCSNFDEMFNWKNYKFEITDKGDNSSSFYEKRESLGFGSPKKNHILEQRTIPLSNISSDINYSEIGAPLFHKEEEVKEILSFYLHLKESLGNMKKQKISVKEYIRDTYLNSIYSKVIKEKEFAKKDNYSIYLYYEIVQKNKGDTFGELALQHEDSKRTATIVTNTDCILGYLSKNDYETCLSEIELKRRKNEVNFIMSFSIFDQMNWIGFENKYFNYFKREFFNQGETILRQGKPINKIYFIMGGQFEITSTLSIVSLYKIIRQKTNYNFKKLKIKLKKNLNNIRIAICNNKDILGLDDCCFYNTSGEKLSFINATCISNKSIAFTLDITILKELKEKMIEINDNVKAIIAKREKIMLDRLKAIFYQLMKKRQFSYMNKKNKEEKSKENRMNRGYIINNDQINYILNTRKTEENYSPYKNIDLLPKYKDNRPLSEINKNKQLLVNESNNLSLKENIETKKRILSSKKYQSNMDSYNYEENENLNDIKYRKKISDIMTIKGKIAKKENPRIFLKSAVSIKELNEKKNVRKKIKNLFIPLHNIINKEYNILFDWINYKKKVKESYKRINYEESDNKLKNDKNESEFEGNSKQLSFSSDDENTKKKEKKVTFEINKTDLNDDTSKFFKHKIHNKRRTLKNLFNEVEKKNKNKKITKKVSKSTNYKNINNKRNDNFLNDNQINLIKKSNNYYTNSKNYYLKFKTLSNEAYLKQILGTKYKNEEDKFISKTEQKLIQEINDYNLFLKRKNQSRIKFLKKNKELKQIFYANSEFNNQNSNNDKGIVHVSTNYDLKSSNNFNINKLKKIYKVSS